MTPKNISDDIPAELKTAIRNVVSLFSRINPCVPAIEIVLLLTNADLEKRRKLARPSASNNMKALEAATRSIPRTDAEGGY